MNKKDSLGDRMKSQYEDRTRYSLPRRTYTIIRLDGKAFHTFTRKFNRPYDERITDWMDGAAYHLCEEIQGVQFAYVQSDEISLLLTDFATIQSQSWFDGNIQKNVSIAASIATAHFNELRILSCMTKQVDPLIANKPAYFDARAFTIPDPVEVANYFIWRQQDAVRNSIQMLAQSLYSHKELQGKNTSELQELTFQKGKNWNDISIRNKRGGFIEKKQYKILNGPEANEDFSIRNKWEISECPNFTVDSLKNYIPRI